MSEEDRFWLKVAKGEPDDCWMWVPNPSGSGYGTFTHLGKPVGAHVFSFFLATGHMPAVLVRHTCDVKLCCNPAHLVEGNASQNAIDAVERKQKPIGSRHPNAKLTEDSVKVIKAEITAGSSLISLARRYHVTNSVICSISKGRTWKHV